ncbi:MAG: VirB8/TrbF family protein [Janthinobacterium lividum]
MLDPHAEKRTEVALRAHYAVVKLQHKASDRRSKRTTTGLAVALTATMAAFCWSAWNTNKLAEKAAGREVVYAVLRDNGEFVTSTHASDVVPITVQGHEIEAALWTYVQARDCYGSSDFIRQYYMAQSMSDEQTAKQLRADVALTNPDRPQRVFGDHRLIVQCELIDPPTPIGDHRDLYLFRFSRWIQGGPPGTDRREPYTVTMRFRTGVYPTDKLHAWMDPSTFNPLGVQVIEYPGAKAQNAIVPALHASLQGDAR